MPDWEELHAGRASATRTVRRGFPTIRTKRQRQLTRMGNAAGAAALTALMAGVDGGEWFARSAERYRESWEHAPPESWGRPIGAIKSRILARRLGGRGRRCTLGARVGAADSDSPFGSYAAALAFAALGEWDDVRPHADYARTHAIFPSEVADALAFIAAEDVVGYVEAVEEVLESFEARDVYLEGVPVADTVLVLQALAGRRGMTAELESELLP